VFLPSPAADEVDAHPASATAWTIIAVAWGLVIIGWTAFAWTPVTTHQDIIGPDTLPVGQMVEGPGEHVDVVVVESSNADLVTDVIFGAWVLVTAVWLVLSVVRRERREVIAVILLAALVVGSFAVMWDHYRAACVALLLAGAIAVAIARWPSRR